MNKDSGFKYKRMKKIVVATDLSPAAKNASAYGLGLAEAFDAKLILASAFEQVPIPITETPVILIPEDMRNVVRLRLEQEAKELAGDRRVTIEGLSCEGGATAAILRVARTQGADLIVAGIKGIGKGFKRTFGSTVTGLARKTTIPLLIIPEGVRFSAPKAIGLASDVYMDARLSIPPAVREFADRFHSKLFIIRLFNKQAGEVIEILHQGAGGNRVVGAFSPLCELPADESVATALNEYIAASPIDLLVMKPHPRMSPETWFLRSDTRQMIFKTNIPLLVLPEEPVKNQVS
jgi:nucleotide-binding universal stress UspA family protein